MRPETLDALVASFAGSRVGMTTAVAAFLVAVMRTVPEGWSRMAPTAFSRTQWSRGQGEETDRVDLLRASGADEV
jgi:hypothetical protein